MIDRDAVTERAGGRCEYCRLPLLFLPALREVDHVRPLKHGGGDHPSNLALSCFFCNSRKGANIAGFDVDGSIVRLFNPRLDQWSDHFRYAGAAIEGLTAIGRVTVSVLDMNSEAPLSVREALLSERFF